MMSATNISYAAGGRKILQDLSCTLEPGRLTVVLGANGAGKSTLLKILAGEIKPSSGQLHFNGKEYAKISAIDFACRRAVLTQHYTISLPFKCAEIVLMGRYPHFSNKPSAEDHRIVEAAMAEMQVEEFAGRYYHTLSGGEQQRVQMARVLAQLWPVAEAGAQKVMLLDEPVSSLDCLHQQKCLQTAKGMARAGFAVMAVLHDLNLAAQYADNILLLRKGRMIAAGETRSVLIPEAIKEAYDYEVEIIYHNDFDFPLIVPTVHKKQSFILTSKTA